jgi:threonine aldolase
MTRTIDFRSDTVTRPGQGMLDAIAGAQVGDVCFNDDPTVHRLEAMAAERTGKEAAIYVPTGTMANQVGLALHLRPGDAVLADSRAHIACWESAAGAAYVGAQIIQIPTTDGLPDIPALEGALFPNHPKAPRIRLLALENTHNSAGGLAHTPAAMGKRVSWARGQGFSAHLDGARLFNAAVACETTVAAYAAHFDTVSLCLSKGLGAPVGSVLVGDKPAIVEADRIRHRLGGGWRQGGFMAAAGIYALEHHVDRLVDDHRRARVLAEAMVAGGIAKPCHQVMTNIIYFDVDPSWGTAAAYRDALASQGVLVTATAAQQGRLVTHLDVDEDATRQAAQIIGGL